MDRETAVLGTLPSSLIATGTATAFILVLAFSSVLFDRAPDVPVPWALRGAIASVADQIPSSASPSSPVALPAGGKQV